jgi:hypothetical protein
MPEDEWPRLADSLPGIPDGPDLTTDPDRLFPLIAQRSYAYMRILT